VVADLIFLGSSVADRGERGRFVLGLGLEHGGGEGEGERGTSFERRFFADS